MEKVKALIETVSKFLEENYHFVLIPLFVLLTIVTGNVILDTVYILLALLTLNIKKNKE